jgi:hypothetical protein
VRAIWFSLGAVFLLALWLREIFQFAGVSPSPFWNPDDAVLSILSRLFATWKISFRNRSSLLTCAVSPSGGWLGREPPPFPQMHQ